MCTNRSQFQVIFVMNVKKRIDKTGNEPSAPLLPQHSWHENSFKKCVCASPVVPF